MLRMSEKEWKVLSDRPDFGSIFFFSRQGFFISFHQETSKNEIESISNVFMRNLGFLSVDVNFILSQRGE